jgi:RimJ/RimL family protein N-acetyltransferase
VTEYGVAYLYGKSIRERCLALIEIAHPDCRRALFSSAKDYQYLSRSQPGFSFQSTYPEQYESYYTSKTTKRVVFIRPIKVADEDLLRSFFHKLSDHSVYLRYFRHMRSMSHRILQKYTDLDYSSDMALLALYPKQDIKSNNIADESKNLNMPISRANEAQQQYELVGIGQWISDLRDGVPEIAFQVRDDWQGEGLATHLFRRLVEVASSHSFTCGQFKAEVLAENRGMRHVFEKSGVTYRTKCEFGVITYIFDLPNHDEIQQKLS